MHCLLEYWDNGDKKQSQEENQYTEIKMEDWFVQEIYIGVFLLVPEAG